MAEDKHPSNGCGRLDRIERAIENLVAAQAKHEAAAEIRFARIEGVLERISSTQDRHEQELDGVMEILQRSSTEFEQRFKAFEQRFKAFEERSKATEEKLNALISIVDDLVRRRPPQAN